MSFDKISNFEAVDYTLSKFIEQRGPSKFIIPDYQRRFVWETKNLTDFVDSIVSNDRGYYIGTIVDVRPSQRSYDIEIIDGQQRITTLTFCVKVLLDLSQAKAIEAGSKIPEDLLNFTELFVFHDTSPRLVFNSSFFNNHLTMLLRESNPLDTPVVQDWIRGIHNKSSENTNPVPISNKTRSNVASYKSLSRLFNTYKDIQNYFKDFDYEELLDAFYKIAHLQLIEITCDERKIVNTLFEGMNSKGVLLSNAELIKNKLFAKIDSFTNSDNDGDTCKDLWDDIDQLFYVESDKRMFDKFLRHFYISKRGYISGNKVYDQYVKDIAELESLPSMVEFISELREYAQYYVDIHHMQLKHDSHGLQADTSVYGALNDFGRLNNEQVYEILLGIIRLIKADPYRLNIKTRELKIILQKLWSFCFRLQFIPISPSKYENRFADICLIIINWSEGGESLYQHLFKYISVHLRPMVGDEKQFTTSMSAEFGYRENKQNHKLLEKIFYDLFAASDTSKSFDRSYVYKKPTIEHIMPQKSEKWNYRKSDIKDFVNNLGNLTLLDEYENNLADNHLFEYKYLNVYAKNKYKFNNQLNEYQEGFIAGNIKVVTETIELRSQKLAKDIFDIYAV